ncbi:MAG: flagellar basal body rod protein FlgB [Pseudomonadota bacterium]
MPINIDKALGIFPQALTLRARRAEIIAANMANADTPNYKARDIDFKGALRQATDSGSNYGATLKRTDARHLTAGGDAMSEAVKYRIPHQSSLDGNTVDAETEQAEFTRNAVQYQATLTFLSGRIRGLMTAIRGD